MDSGFRSTRFKDSDSRPNLSCIGARFGLLRLHGRSAMSRESSISWSVFFYVGWCHRPHDRAALLTFDHGNISAGLFHSDSPSSLDLRSPNTEWL
jgi:hypothetical protein